MKLLSAKQIGWVDKFTIENEPIDSIDLMERAALKIVNKLLSHQQMMVNYHLQNGDGEIKVFCGVGNNGGDGLVIARYLKFKGYRVNVFLVKYSNNLSKDCQINLNEFPTEINLIKSSEGIPEISNEDLIIDAIFGSGLSRPITGFTKSLVHAINNSNAKVVAVDVPSGLMADDNRENDFEAIVKADLTYTFQLPKRSFLLPSYAQFTGNWEVLDIGLLPEGLIHLETNKFLVDHEFAKALYQPRNIFSHKGTFGHSLIVGGSLGKMGAVVLAAKSALKTGAGLVSAHVPKIGLNVLQTSAPEVMVQLNDGDDFLSPSINTENIDAIGFGIGVGTANETAKALKLLIQNATAPLVIDADGLNILAENKTWLAFLPPETILTPHPGEFKRLVGNWETDEEKVDLLIDFCRKFNVFTVLKGAFTITCTPSGNTYFNTTGNNGMATAGSGDCLLGIITSLRGQGYSGLNSTILGTYLHGLAGDFAQKEVGFEALTASGIIENLGRAFRYME